MKTAQISTLLNTKALVEMTGQGVLVNEDLSNIVDAGKAVLDFVNTTDNFNTYVSGLIDQIGRYKFWDRVYKSVAPSILVDSNEYGSILAKSRVEVPDFKDTSTWNLATMAANRDSNGYNGIGQNPDLDPFILEPPTAELKFWNTRTTYTAPITIAKKQLKDAFTSPEQMARFIAQIENRIRMKRTLSNDAMIMRCIDNFMVLKIANGGYVDVAAAYATATGQTAPTVANYESNKEFLRWVAKFIDKMRAYFREASVLNNQSGYVTFTPDENQKLVIIKNLDSGFKYNLYSDTFNEEYVKVSGYETVNAWQGVGTSQMNIAREGLDITAQDESGSYTCKTTSGQAILGCLFDIEGCACVNKDDRVTSQYNPRTESTTFFYMYDAEYINDIIENGIVFGIGSITAPKNA